MAFKPIWLLLMEQAADVNIIYPELSHKSKVHGLEIPALSRDPKAKKRESAASAKS